MEYTEVVERHELQVLPRTRRNKMIIEIIDNIDIMTTKLNRA